MNTLEIRRIGYKYKIDDIEQEKPHFQTEFIVDGISLSKQFNFEHSRSWFDQTEFESGDKEIDALKGLVPPPNQLNNGNFVLYRCHCGYDCCGVIACEIVRTETSVIWRNIYHGDEGGDFSDEDDEGDTSSLAVKR